MTAVDWIEHRVGLPTDSETYRAQKVLGIGMAYFGCLGTLITAVLHYLAGLDQAGHVFILMAIILFLCASAILWRPTWFPTAVRIGLLVTILANALGQALAGGLTAGTFVIVWAVVGLIGTVLLAGWRFSIVLTLVYCLSVIAIVLLDPQIRGLSAQAPLGSRLLIGAYCLVFMGIFIVGSTTSLFSVVERLRLRADELLLNILPAPVAGRLKQNPGTIADGYSEVTVLFADIVDFTSMSSDADPVAVVNLLNDVFSALDDLAIKHGLEKIKTIGDAYMVAAGLPDPRPDHAQAAVEFALEMLAEVKQLQGLNGQPIRFRVGINSGPVVAGVIGRQKFIYDLWGDAVNVASRMESNGLASQIQVTETVKNKLDRQYTFREREPIFIKGKGIMVTYLLTGRV